jgi:MYXO-CTERM domain-containing protein
MARSLGPVSCATISSILSLTSAALADCYVDSVAGSDTNNGTSEATAVKSPSKVASSCAVVKFKRGSEFKVASGVQNLGIPNMYSIKTLTNYGESSLPLPKFVKDHVDGSGAMIEGFQGNLTIDGLYLSGSKSANDMGQLIDGICVMLGANSTIQNCEITLCDIGMMTSGDNVKVLHNYVHDLSISVDAAPGVDPNQVGGAEGIFVNSSHVEVAYNRFINCSTAAQWCSNTNGGGVRCDGGATEVTVPYGGEVTDVHIHHNFSYNSCGFFEVSSMPNTGSGGYVKGKFTNSEFHDNVMVDSGWISLLQINNTRLTNVRWENNTIVHHYLGTTTDADGKTVDLNDFASSYLQVIPFNSTSSGVTGGGVLEQGDVYWTNNLWYFDPQIFNKFPSTGVDATHPSSDQFIKNIVITGDKFFTTDPGFLDITSTANPNAYDLKTGGSTIDQGVTNSNIATDVPTDFLDRTRPYGSGYDLGAFEYQGTSATGGSSSTGGKPATGTGGASSGGAATKTGGTTATGGTGGNPGTETCNCRLARESSESSRGPVGLLALIVTVLLRRRRAGNVAYADARAAWPGRRRVGRPRRRTAPTSRPLVK